MKTIIGAGLAAAMSSAFAAPVASFGYTQEFEFTDPITPASVVKEGATTGVSGVDGYTKLSWGTPFASQNPQNQPSSIVINPTAGDNNTPSNDLTQGNVATSMDFSAVTFADGPKLVHNNWVITGNALESANAQDHVILTPAGGSALPAREITFGINFKETLNASNPCPSIGNEFGCGDIFVISGGLPGEAVVVNTDEIAFLVEEFTVAGYKYTVLLREAGDNLAQLSDEACAAANAESGCIGFLTEENKSNEFQLEFAIVATAVPEPTTLALFAAPLLLLGARRRKAAK